jgi:hypothetical protein
MPNIAGTTAATSRASGRLRDLSGIPPPERVARVEPEDRTFFVPKAPSTGAGKEEPRVALVTDL